VGAATPPKNCQSGWRLRSAGDEGFEAAPVGAGPYRFVSFTPGVELVLEAFD
jgi:peptide/nickel transport system substrate-binding protein